MEMIRDRSMAESLIEWDIAQLTLEGQGKSGDRYFVKSFANSVLVAVLDGLGHGDEAAAAAQVAVDTLETNSQNTGSGDEHGVVEWARRDAHLGGRRQR